MIWKQNIQLFCTFWLLWMYKIDSRWLKCSNVMFCQVTKSVNLNPYLFTWFSCIFCAVQNWYLTDKEVNRSIFHCSAICKSHKFCDNFCPKILISQSNKMKWNAIKLCSCTSNYNSLHIVVRALPLISYNLEYEEKRNKEGEKSAKYLC